MIKQIFHNQVLLAIVIRHSFSKDGIEFFTPDSFSQQLAYMKRPTGYIIEPHTHNLVERKIDLTQEVLYIKSGLVRVDFYDNERVYLKSMNLYAGDVILLASGGHGFEIIEEAEIIEVKQGPYAGEKDKTRFETTTKNIVIED